MVKRSLSGSWNLEILGDSPFSGERLKARIPGSVYSALLDAGKIPDPHWRDNELEALKIMDNDFAFTHDFDIEGDGFNAEKILLICEGLDTLCDLELNGEKIGYADNMHRTWEFDITKRVKNNGNELKLTFRSPTKYIAERHSEIFVDGTPDAMRGFTQIRKAHCMFGWDWGPRLPDAGIWRDISVGYVSEARLESVYVTQNHVMGGDMECGDGPCVSSVELNFEIECSGSCGGVEITVTAPDGTVYKTGSRGTVLLLPQEAEEPSPCFLSYTQCRRVR